MTPNKTDTVRVKQLLDDWYHIQAQRVIRKRLVTMLPRVEHLGITQPTLAIKPLRARWGSCSGSRMITLNVRFIQVPKQYIDYVIEGCA